MFSEISPIGIFYQIDSFFRLNNYTGFNESLFLSVFRNLDFRCLPHKNAVVSPKKRSNRAIFFIFTFHRIAGNRSIPPIPRKYLIRIYPRTECCNTAYSRSVLKVGSKGSHTKGRICRKIPLYPEESPFRRGRTRKSAEAMPPLPRKATAAATTPA